MTINPITKDNNMPTEMPDRHAANLARLLAQYIDSMDPADVPDTVADLATDLLATVPNVLMDETAEATLDRYVESAR
jgi:hypothetical protein